MTKYITTTLIAITCTSFFACSQTPTSSTPLSSSSSSLKDNQPSVTADELPRAVSSSVDSKEFLDVFVGTQKCVVEKLTELSNSDSPQKPPAEEIAKISKAFDEKSQNTANTTAAWGELTKGCNDTEITSIQNFFACQKDACDEPNLTAANEKHKKCAEPEAGEGCKKSFSQFMNHFSPF